MKASSVYPKPQVQGGHLIRKLIAGCREGGLSLPIDSHILIAVSGGSDSLALAHLLLKYGRRVVGRDQIRLLHVNHGWRGEDSRADANFVAEFGKNWGVPVDLFELKDGSATAAIGAHRHDSWEELARTARQSIYGQASLVHNARVLTAHQADDLAETLLWRIFTGGAQTHGGGIATSHGPEVRPLLRVRKTELQTYLKEEGQVWREDETNHAGRFLRSQMRRDLMPRIEALFPRAIEHLTELAVAAQGIKTEQGFASDAPDATQNPSFEAMGMLLDASGLKLRRAHWAALRKSLQKGTQGAIDLPGGWRLFQDRRAGSRWVLESRNALSGD